MSNQLPPNWRLLTIENCMEEIIDYRGKTPNKTSEGIPLITAKIVKDGYISKPDEYIAEEDYDSWMRRGIPKAGDIVMTTEAPLGEIAQLDERRVALAQRLITLRGKPEILDNNFLKYIMQSEQVQEELRARATGTTVLGIRQSELRKVLLPIPPLSEQKAIAHVLGTLDDKIELNRRMNETLEAMARAIFKSWFVDFDPVRAKSKGRDTGLPDEIASLFPSEFVDSELGEIPKGWKISSIREEFNLTMGQSPPGETYNEIGEGLPFFQGRSDFGFRFPSRRMYCSAPKRLANIGDTLVSVRAPVGDINMADDLCCIGRGVSAIRHKSGSRSFTHYMIKSLTEYFLNYEAEGTVFGCINKNDFEGIQCIAPYPDVVKLFESEAYPLDEIILRNEKETQILIDIRDSLLPKLISGKIRIKDIEKFMEGKT